MIFTREPMIETIITPKEGYQLLIRNSRGGQQEDFHVDAVEVVSFGRSFFFRSQERPKAFLLPVSEYEVVEVKETRMPLKKASLEKTIKIGGGKKESIQVTKETPRSEEVKETKKEQKKPKRNDTLKKEEKEITPPPIIGEKKGGEAIDETRVSSSRFRTLLPPPPGLISEKISHYKDQEVSKKLPFEEEVIKEEQIPPLIETEEPPPSLLDEGEDISPLIDKEPFSTFDEEDIISPQETIKEEETPALEPENEPLLPPGFSIEKLTGDEE